MGVPRVPTEQPGFGGFCVLGGMYILGLTLGQLWFAFARGIAPVSPFPPSWLSGVLAAIALIGAVWFKERLFRIALLLFAGVELLRVAEGLSGHVATGSLHDGLQLLWAVFLAAAGWRSSRAWVRWASLVVLIAAVPLRFWVLERLFGTSSVV